jgi:putrescine aminotransferase
MEREDLVGRVRTDTGPYLAKRLRDVAAHRLVGEARSEGLIGAVEIVADKRTNERFAGREGQAAQLVRDLCIKNGLMVRAVRDSLVMSPPLVISRAEIDSLVSIILKSLDEAEPQLRTLQARAPEAVPGG